MKMQSWFDWRLPLILATTAWFGVSSIAIGESTRPNVLMIAIDDLNDWVEPLGGHPQVRTPAMNRLAARGVTFTNAHCQSPLCNPSRTSLMTGLRPSTTGVYGLSPWFRTLPEFQNARSLPQHFAEQGYATYTAGKIYHGGSGRKNAAGTPAEFQHWGPPSSVGARPPKKLVPPTPAGNNGLVDWGVFDHADEDKGDWQLASWAETTLDTLESSEQPFFLSVGFFLPHVPCYVTQKWWDMYPEASLKLPVIDERDRDDCSPFSWYLHWNLPEPRLSWLRENDEHANLVRAYLASVSFVDSQVGRVLDALDASGHADNTIVVLWSDHGWHLGEKLITGKNTLWERSSRVPLIFAGPGISRGVCGQPAELLDVYPTLAELAGLPPADSGISKHPIDGISLVPQLRNVDRYRERPAITEHNPGNFGIRDQRYRLIHYADGSEELYDLQNDPREFTNRIDDPALASVAGRLRGYVRSNPAPLAPGSAARILEKRGDDWFWEGKRIDPDHPLMPRG